MRAAEGLTLPTRHMRQTGTIVLGLFLGLLLGGFLIASIGVALAWPMPTHEMFIQRLGEFALPTVIICPIIGLITGIIAAFEKPPRYRPAELDEVEYRLPGL